MIGLRGRGAALAVAVVCALALAGGAVASNFTPPKLKSPHPGGHVTIGHIALKVYDPGLSGVSSDVFLAISKKRSVDKNGFLKGTCNVDKGCDFVEMKRWKHHAGWWIYTPPSYSFPGFWATTQGKYYWQARHVPPACGNGHGGLAPGCELVSKIQTFHVVG